MKLTFHVFEYGRMLTCSSRECLSEQVLHSVHAGAIEYLKILYTLYKISELNL